MLTFNIAVVFPGQGSQSIGMLKQYAETSDHVEQTFQQAADVLGYDLWDIVANGPQEKLNHTEITQPAMLAADVAVMRIMTEMCMNKPYALAGHSLGEYAALVASGVLDFQDAIKLVAQRGRLMQNAVPEGEGAMAAIIGPMDEQVIKVCESATAEIGQPVEAVNFNSPGQIVIAGATAAVDRAIELLVEEGAKRALKLPVSVPSHSSLMKPAADEMAKVLETVNFNEPQIQVIHNCDAKSHEDPASIREALTKQICNPVRWVQTIKIITEDADAIIECGPGRVLTGLNKRIDKEIKSFALDTPASMEKFLDSMS
ncbi:MAG: ACP S-malonyltransferase [Gammaproteobacteria bacterium]|nr:ACP S-malonyltransferase [Gammaproteobacteria bacterium]